MTFYLVLSLFLVLVGHAFRLLRWEQFIRIYERPLRGQMLRGMAGGYALNFVLPFHLGDVFRAVFTGRRMKSGIGFALATVIMDRFLDVWFVALGFGAFWALGQGGAAVLGAAQYYLVFSLVLALGLVLVVALRDLLKKGCLAFCGLFNDTLKLDGMMFFWSLINTFKDLGRIKIGRLVVNTVLMWAAYLGSYTALAAALTAAGQPMALVDVFDLLFGRNAADLSALLPGGAMGAAAPAARILLLCWFALPLLAMWLVTLLPEKVRGAVNQATQAAPAGESYLNLLPQADPQDRAAFLSQYFGLQNKEWVKGFLKMNQGITILQDYSAGSNATTMLCMDAEKTFYRKYAFGADGDKLAEQLAWLRADLSFVPKQKMVILCYHIPLRSGTARNMAAVKALLSEYAEAHLMAAHTHYNENFINTDADGGLYEHIHGAPCGVFWHSALNGDGTPNGYAVYDVEGAAITDWRYKSSLHDESFQIRLHRGGDTHSGFTYPYTPKTVIANVWNADPEWRVTLCENGVETKAMTLVTTYTDAWSVGYHVGVLGRGDNYKSPCKHMYVAEPNDVRAALKVVAVDRWGNRYEQSEFTAPDDFTDARSPVY